MATAPDSSAAAKPDGVAAVTTSAAGSGAAVSSPQPRRSLQAPWAQVVRGGGEPEPQSAPASPLPEKMSSPEKTLPEVSTLPEGSESNNDGNVGKVKKQAWNKPLNGVVVEAVTVMGGAVSWPALSDATKPGPKSPIPDGSTSLSQGPIISQSPQKEANVNASKNSNANPATPLRLRSMKYNKGGSSSGGGGSGPSGGAFIRTPPPPPPPLPPPFPVMPYPPPVLEPPVRGSRPVGGFTNDHSHHRNHGRKNFGGRPRGDGSYHNNHGGGRRDQDRRDVHMAPLQFAPPPPPFMRPPPPPGAGPFLPPPMRPYVTPMGYDMAPYFFVPPLSPEPYSGVPIINQAPQLPQHLPLVDPNLPPSLINQIEYYFSDANLVKDDFLRLKMDEEGWVPITLIANFPRVKSLTEKVQSDNIQFILHCLRASTFVEVQDEKVRRRDGWRKWTHTSGQLAADSGSSTPVASTDGGLTASLQNVSLNESAISSATEETNAQPEVAAGGLSDESTKQSKPAQEEDSTEEISTNHA
ncbi:la-related protein 1B-like [Lycium ferocissimum]|uniref:la-related protein 1B-like n=1 Tax=Lycium ferocissimum TaxID=112874 RepID=UPI0028153F5D|nr:la-related protein 1B-like [Lycium ferocissimum]